jgi:predicted transcriptional regulator of viral defense system
MKKAFTQSNWIEVLRKGKSIYNFAEFMRISMLPVPSLRRAIQRLLKKRLLLKLSKELYANPLAAPSLEEVASVLYPPTYISLESALFMHGISEQAPHLLTCVSTNKTKTFRTDLGEIAYFHLKRELFFGYDITDRVPLAWPEKAALDFVYIQRQNGLTPSLDEWNWESLNVDKMNSLAKSYPETVKTHIKEFLPSQS